MRPVSSRLSRYGSTPTPAPSKRDALAPMRVAGLQPGDPFVTAGGSANRRQIGRRALCHATSRHEFRDQSFRFAVAQRRQITATRAMRRGLLMGFRGGLGKPLVLFHDVSQSGKREIKRRAAARRRRTADEAANRAWNAAASAGSVK